MLDYAARTLVFAEAANLTAVATDTGGKLHWDTVAEAALTIRGTFGANDLILIASPKGIEDLKDDLRALGVGWMNNTAATPLIEALIMDGGLPDDGETVPLHEAGHYFGIELVPGTSEGYYINFGHVSRSFT